MQLPNKITVVGHSHSACLVSTEVAATRFEVLNFWAMPGALETRSGDPRIAEHVIERFTTPMISMCGGGAHTVLGLARHPRPFDFILPGAPNLPLDPEAELLPYAAVRRQLEADAREYFVLAHQIVSAAPGPVWHVDVPPPISSAETMRPHIPWSLFPGRNPEISPRWHRYRMWRLNTEISRAWCQQNGVGFIGHVEQAEDEDGFLKADFSDDGIHANRSYGQLLAEKIVAILSNGPAGPKEFAPTLSSRK